MVNYKELGLVNTRKMFAKAVDGGYAIPAFNFNNMEHRKAHATTPTRPCCAIWPKARWNTPRNWAAPILKSCFTLTTATASSYASRASTWASPR